MDNQHKHIKGHRDLSQGEIDLMNEIKQKASECGDLCLKLKEMNTPPGDRHLDQRWVAIGTTDLQTGFMALVRAVAQQTSF